MRSNLLTVLSYRQWVLLEPRCLLLATTRHINYFPGYFSGPRSQGRTIRTDARREGNGLAFMAPFEEQAQVLRIGGSAIRVTGLAT